MFNDCRNLKSLFPEHIIKFRKPESNKIGLWQFFFEKFQIYDIGGLKSAKKIFIKDKGMKKFYSSSCPSSVSWSFSLLNALE
jgi:hypothetical protein